MLKDKWSEYKFIECLGVLPEIDQTWEQWHRYKLFKDKLLLELDLCAYRDLINVSLAKKFDTEPFFSFFLLVKGNVVHINEKNISCLKFENCLVLSDEYDNPDIYTELNFEIHIYPKIKLKYS